MIQETLEKDDVELRADIQLCVGIHRFKADPFLQAEAGGIGPGCIPGRGIGFVPGDMDSVDRGQVAGQQSGAVAQFQDLSPGAESGAGPVQEALYRREPDPGAPFNGLSQGWGRGRGHRA